MPSSTPHADELVGHTQEELQSELRRLRLLELDCQQRQAQTQANLEEEKRKQEGVVSQKLEEVSKMEKGISTFLKNTAQSITVDARLLRETQAATTAKALVGAFLGFQKSPTTLTALLGEEDDDDGVLSGLLLDLCRSVREGSGPRVRPDIVLACETLEHWILTRVNHRFVFPQYLL
jgi:hypothetical protein